MNITLKQFLMLAFISVQFFTSCSVDIVFSEDVANDMKNLLNINHKSTLQQDVYNDTVQTNLKKNNHENNMVCMWKTFPKGIDASFLNQDIVAYMKDQLKPLITYKTFLTTIKQATNLLKSNLKLENYPNPHKTINVFTRAIKVKDSWTLHKIGDLHGSLHDLINFIFKPLNKNGEKGFDENFKLKPLFKKHKWIFLGDCIDSGKYSLEITTLIYYLYCQNPKNIFIGRGNHEEMLSRQAGAPQYGFLNEIKIKYPNLKYKIDDYEEITSIKDDQNNDVVILLKNLWDLSPVGLWLIQKKQQNQKHVIDLCVHGGFEPQDNVRQWLNEFLNSDKKCEEKTVDGDYENLLNLGYTGADFIVNCENKKPGRIYTTNRGERPSISTEDFEKWKNENFDNNIFSFHKIIRAHQHIVSMLGGCMTQLNYNYGICLLLPERNVITGLSRWH